MDVDLTGMEMDAQLLLSHHSIKAGTTTHAGRGSGYKAKGGAGSAKKGRGQPPLQKGGGVGLGL